MQGKLLPHCAAALPLQSRFLWGGAWEVSQLLASKSVLQGKQVVKLQAPLKLGAAVTLCLPPVPRMTRHGKNCTAGAVYTYHEKKKDTGTPICPGSLPPCVLQMPSSHAVSGQVLSGKLRPREDLAWAGLCDSTARRVLHCPPRSHLFLAMVSPAPQLSPAPQNAPSLGPPPHPCILLLSLHLSSTLCCPQRPRATGPRTFD